MEIKICKKCGAVKEGSNGKRCKPCAKEYRKRPEVKERIKDREKEYRQCPKRKAYMKEYGKRPNRKAYVKEYEQRLDRKVYMKEYEQRLDRKVYMNEYNKRRPQTPDRKAYMNEYMNEYQKKFGGGHHRRAEKRGNYAERVKRIDIFTRDKFRCAYCKKKLKFEDCVLEHKIPIAKGGSNTPENCTTSCQPCNSAKAAKLLDGLQISIFDVVK